MYGENWPWEPLQTGSLPTAVRHKRQGKGSWGSRSCHSENEHSTVSCHLVIAILLQSIMFHIKGQNVILVRVLLNKQENMP